MIMASASTPTRASASNPYDSASSPIASQRKAAGSSSKLTSLESESEAVLNHHNADLHHHPNSNSVNTSMFTSPIEITASELDSIDDDSGIYL